MKIYLDDQRPTPRGWIGVLWPEDAIAFLQTGQVTHLSLDHDLGDDSHGTGYDVVVWVEEQTALYGFTPPIMTVHSDNGPGRQRMLAGIESITRFYYKNVIEP